MVRSHIIVHGHVQGVGFRATTKQIAEQLDLNGWVKNKNDGSVEIEAEGDSSNLKQFVDQLNDGPTPFAKVEAIDIEDFDSEKGYETFKVKE
ncbi:acylphosphatase [Halobacillus sp. BBL2006]|uniref:acylphosphatase n=1 Tax=Halobacillus sp. BBL2006 TaxID=1543706 RepID=UPI000541E624|nr:acylphosphatase [Halobacillus sp. BBL2006]KHE71180.1 acylphosphatase [Halobacillus sp. BBL2006]